ncbi:SGNH/GDSL hydrolase family protein [Chryseobacterium arthrosphaerae]|nr:hypothetical protein [Chryseobacterium arthrosphaerae]
MNEFLGRHSGEGGGYLAFGETQAYTDLMTAFFNGGKGGITNKGGALRWWTDYDDPDPNVKGVGILGILKFKSSYEYDSDMHKISQDLRTWGGMLFLPISLHFNLLLIELFYMELILPLI